MARGTEAIVPSCKTPQSRHQTCVLSGSIPRAFRYPGHGDLTSGRLLGNKYVYSKSFSGPRNRQFIAFIAKNKRTKINWLTRNVSPDRRSLSISSCGSRYPSLSPIVDVASDNVAAVPRTTKFNSAASHSWSRQCQDGASRGNFNL